MIRFDPRNTYWQVRVVVVCFHLRVNSWLPNVRSEVLTNLSRVVLSPTPRTNEFIIYSSNFYFVFQMNTALQQQRLEVEQLRREAAMKRIPVSQAVEDIKVK